MRGGNPFRAKAYARAADNLLALSLPLDQIIAQDRLREIPGIGDAIADIIKKLHATGTHRLQKVKGLGASLQTKILRGIEMRREAQGRRHMHKADELLKAAEKNLREARPEILGITRAGDFRRGSELAGDLSLVAEVPKLPDGPKAITAGGQLTAHLTDRAHYGITLLLATGSDAHVAGIRALAAERNMIFDEKGCAAAGKWWPPPPKSRSTRRSACRPFRRNCVRDVMRLRGPCWGRCRSL